MVKSLVPTKKCHSCNLVRADLLLLLLLQGVESGLEALSLARVPGGGLLPLLDLA